MTRKKATLYLLLLIVGFSAGYFLKPTIITAPTEYLPSEAAKESKIPECFAFQCPRYFAMTVDKDYQADESVVIVPTAMTQGAGKIMIVKKGKVIFESPEMPGIGIDSVDDGDGFILHYNSQRDENFNSVQYSVRYRYVNGQFKPDALGAKEKEKECVDNNGIWTKGSFGGEPFCNKTFSDGGKTCNDSSDCLSQRCLSNTQDNGSSIVGACSDRVSVYGCYGLVKKGRVTNYACID